MNEPPPQRQRTPWWIQFMVGVVGLSAAMIYAFGAIAGPDQGRNAIFAGLWGLFGLLWIVFALVSRSREQ